MSAPNEKAWAFTLHGHVFYVLNQTVDGKTLICDLSTGQWHHWFTGESAHWNMFRGIMWNGHALAADGETAKVWEVDPYSELDEEVLPIVRRVTGFQAVRGDFSFRQGSLRVTASVGFPAADPASLAMRFSDDGGQTWVGPYTNLLVPGKYGQVLEYRSLGRLRAPGRIWEFFDTGGLVRIEGADSDMDAGVT